MRDPLKLIYSIRLKQKSNPEPLNPEPVNGCEIFIRDALGQVAGMRTDVLRLREKARMSRAVHRDKWPIYGYGDVGYSHS